MKQEGDVNPCPELIEDEEDEIDEDKRVVQLVVQVFGQIGDRLSSLEDRLRNICSFTTIKKNKESLNTSMSLIDREDEIVKIQEMEDLLLTSQSCSKDRQGDLEAEASGRALLKNKKAFLKEKGRETEGIPVHPSTKNKNVRTQFSTCRSSEGCYKKSSVAPSRSFQDRSSKPLFLNDGNSLSSHLLRMPACDRNVGDNIPRCSIPSLSMAVSEETITLKCEKQKLPHIKEQLMDQNSKQLTVPMVLEALEELKGYLSRLKDSEIQSCGLFFNSAVSKES